MVERGDEGVGVGRDASGARGNDGCWRGRYGSPEKQNYHGKDGEMTRGPGKGMGREVRMRK